MKKYKYITKINMDRVIDNYRRLNSLSMAMFEVLFLGRSVMAAARTNGISYYYLRLHISLFYLNTVDQTIKRELEGIIVKWIIDSYLQGNIVSRRSILKNARRLFISRTGAFCMIGSVWFDELRRLYPIINGLYT